MPARSLPWSNAVTHTTTIARCLMSYLSATSTCRWQLPFSCITWAACKVTQITTCYSLYAVYTSYLQCNHKLPKSYSSSSSIWWASASSIKDFFKLDGLPCADGKDLKLTLLVNTVQLPNGWLWDMVDEFIYQFQSFQQYRGRLSNKSQEELALLRKCDNIWNTSSVLNYLQALVDKSKIVEELTTEGSCSQTRLKLAC